MLHLFLVFSRLCGRQVREKFGEKPANVGGIEHPFVFALLRGSPSASTNLVCIKTFTLLIAAFLVVRLSYKLLL